jgi:D-sedoheptulose 7-phosphate isomerase
MGASLSDGDVFVPCARDSTVIHRHLLPPIFSLPVSLSGLFRWWKAFPLPPVRTHPNSDEKWVAAGGSIGMVGPMDDYLADCMERYPSLGTCREAIGEAYDALAETFAGGGKLLVCGNGGSAADASHIVGELMKSFRRKREIDGDIGKAVGEEIAANLQGALPAISLPDMVAIGTAYANDCDPRYVFAQLTYGLGRAGDTLLCISTSGNATNVIIAAIVARARGMRTIGLTGATGGKLGPHCDTCIRVPELETFKIQELHLPVYHTLCAMLERRFFP